MAYADIDAGKVLNKEGLLELSNQIKSYVDANVGSGGGSYTAGDGIDIDSNGVISKINGLEIQLMMTANNSSSYNPYLVRTTANTTWEEFLAMLRQGKVVLVEGSPEWSEGYRHELNATTFPTINNKFYYRNLDGAENTIYSAGGSCYPRSGLVYYYDGVVLFQWQDGYEIARHLGISLTGESNRRPLGQYLDRFNNSIKALDTRIPSPPTTDGTYMLKCVVSSGTPTYSWEEITVGGSY